MVRSTFETNGIAATNLSVVAAKNDFAQLSLL